MLGVRAVLLSPTGILSSGLSHRHVFHYTNTLTPQPHDQLGLQQRSHLGSTNVKPRLLITHSNTTRAVQLANEQSTHTHTFKTKDTSSIMPYHHHCSNNLSMSTCPHQHTQSCGNRPYPIPGVSTDTPGTNECPAQPQSWSHTIHKHTRVSFNETGATVEATPAATVCICHCIQNIHHTHTHANNST